MTTQHEFSGQDGMSRKIRTLALSCKAAAEGMPKTLVVGISLPDPMTTPDCEHAAPRGFRLQTLDEDISMEEVATLLGTTYGLLDSFEDYYSRELGERFRELADEARGTYGHGSGMGVVKVEPMKLPAWSSR